MKKVSSKQKIRQDKRARTGVGKAKRRKQIVTANASKFKVFSSKAFRERDLIGTGKGLTEEEIMKAMTKKEE